MAKKYKITVVGAGNVGATTAHIAAVKELGDVVLVDVIPDMPMGKALDMRQLTPVEGASVKIVGSNGYEETAGSDVVIITSGKARTPGMSRDDLLNTNVAIVKDVTENVAKHSPESIIIMVTNPLDAMVYVAKEISGFPKNRVVGMAGILDTARFRTFLSMETGFSVKDITAMVLGGHGDTMVPLARYTTVAGIPITKFVSQDKLDAIIQRTRGGGGEIVKLLGTGSAYYAPAAASVEMAEAILRDQKRVLPCCALCEGEYGIDGYYMGVPAVLGANGLEKIIEVDLDDDEKAALMNSLDAVKSLVEEVKDKI